MILVEAIGAEREGLHRSSGAVVGELLDDGEARTAVDAGDEGIIVAPVAWVEHLA
ncbi:hypothetical protein ES703_102533 [subsurface metagenome]